MTARSLLLCTLPTLLEESELGLVDEGESCSSSKSLNSVHVVTELGRVSLESISFGSGSSNCRTNTHNLGMDGAGYGVVLLDVNLGECEVLLIVCEVVFDVSTRRSVDDVSHLETLDRLILGHASTTLTASNDDGLAFVFLGSTVVPSF